MYKLHEQITPELLGLTMWNFQGIFIWTQVHREIFKSVFVYLREGKKTVKDGATRNLIYNYTSNCNGLRNKNIFPWKFR